MTCYGKNDSVVWVKPSDSSIQPIRPSDNYFAWLWNSGSVKGRLAFSVLVNFWVDHLIIIVLWMHYKKPCGREPLESIELAVSWIAWLSLFAERNKTLPRQGHLCVGDLVQIGKFSGNMSSMYAHFIYHYIPST